MSTMMMAASFRTRAVAMCVPLASIAALGAAAPARAADWSAGLLPSVIDEALIERATTGIYGFLVNASLADDGATTSAPCPMMTTDEFGWFMGQQGLSPNLDGWNVSVFVDWNFNGAPGIDCGVDMQEHFAQVGRGAPHGAILEAMVLPGQRFDSLLAAAGGAIIGPGGPEVGGEFAGVCRAGELSTCIAMWHRSDLVLNVVLGGPGVDVTQDRAVALLSSMIETMVTGLAEHADALSSIGQTTVDAPTTVAVVATPTTVAVVAPTTPTSPSLLDRLAPVPGYAYQVWDADRTDEFLAGPFTPDELDAYVAQFAGIDVVHDGEVIGWIELHLLRPEFQGVPDLDQVVLDTLSGYPYSPGPSTVDRLSLLGEEILVRGTPTLVAWTWHEGGIVFNVVADGVDPGAAGDFVVALSTVQHGPSAPTGGTTVPSPAGVS